MYRPAMSEENFAIILEEIEGGKSLSEVCRNETRPSRFSFYRWLDAQEGDEAAHRYARAAERRAELLFDDILNISDRPLIGVEVKRVIVTDENGDEKTVELEEKTKDAVDRSRLMVDTRKWALAKMNPKKYGDKFDVGVGLGSGSGGKVVVEFVGGASGAGSIATEDDE